MKIRIIKRYDNTLDEHYYSLQYRGLLPFWRDFTAKRDLFIMWKSRVYHDNRFRTFHDVETFVKKRFTEGKDVWIAEDLKNPDVMEIYDEKDFRK